MVAASASKPFLAPAGRPAPFSSLGTLSSHDCPSCGCWKIGRSGRHPPVGRDAEPGSRKTMMLLLVVAGELNKHAKGRILLDLHTVSTRSPRSLQTVGMMLTATSKSLSLSEVCYGTGFRFPWLNTILGVLYGTQLGGRRRRQRSAACRPRGDRSNPQRRHLTSRWTRSAPDRTGSPGAGGAAGAPGRAGLGGGPGWPFWPPLRWRWPLSCWLQPVGMPGTW